MGSKSHPLFSNFNRSWPKSLASKSSNLETLSNIYAKALVNKMLGH